MKIEIPTQCPSCGSKLDLVNGQLFCRNKSNCPAQSSKLIENFCTKMKLKGFGPKTIEKLELTKISELFYLTEEDLVGAVGSKVAAKLISELNTKVRGDIDFGSVLGSLGIPLIGEVAAKKLSQNCTSFHDVKADGKAGENYKTWLNSPQGKDVIELPWKFSTGIRGTKADIIITDDLVAQPNGITICITGSLQDFANRTDATNYLESLGYTVKKSVTKDVKYLICEDESKRSSSSYKKAETNGIEILSIKELLEKNNNV
ncbi:NAD-dependent DNA ligase [Salmonella phage S147]|uniref:DNA ligase n=13 Tax=Caudoviricetes TaxID=2731619 RepID=A0A2Z5HNG1_9CAUD|nr:BRCT domain-containing protein [Citrobacter portucalensis]YP_009794951.1 NAD-dependent DNA ligase [Escherichia phage saus132]YP_009805315.1 NAD-dependent DNA ligase [Salmonella phage S126]YP_009805929.1 NAD-dependent DNA ligase [Salmonella phage S147]YP_009824349.1 NAD-dependent DNA ligase [Escherichia phage vB_Eco_mar003J3]YP_009858936.1 NAD-dependent DNA ligase [Salmonella phage atrejo]ASU02482.1 DNA ligase [Bacteriophage T5-like chee130_1]ASU02787.1 DNA ligase [Bacteriophage T5-like po